jgi:hypothetical protein
MATTATKTDAKAAAKEVKAVAGERATDLRRAAIELRDAVRVHRTPPPRTRGDRALWEAWNAILRPRLPRLGPASEWFADAQRWEYEGDVAVRLVPGLWASALSHASALFVTLRAAAGQYGRVRVVFRPPNAFGIVRGAPSAPGATRAERDADRRTTDARRDQREARLARTLEAASAGLAATRDALAAQAHMVQTLVARMQHAEEMRLGDDCEMCFEVDRGDRAVARETLRLMKIGRLNAESFAGERSSEYGSLLRRDWLRHHRSLMKRVERAT